MVGSVLLVAIVLLSAAVSAGMLLGMSDNTSPAPTARVTLDVSAGACTAELVHQGGETIDGDRVKVVGAKESRVLDGREFSAGSTVAVTPIAEEMKIVWSAADSGQSYIVARLQAGDQGSKSSPWACRTGITYTEYSGSIRVVTGTNDSVLLIPTPAEVEALGPTAVDITGDGVADTPYINSNGHIVITNQSNDTTTLTTGAAISGSIARDKTRIGVGTWNGSDTSVFFVDKNHDAIYRVDGSGSPVEVASPPSGAQAVAGVGDIDADGAGELVFADGSQQLRYLEPNGTVESLPDSQTGSNNGIGSGSLADFDGDGTVSVVAVDGSNNLKIIGDSMSSGGEGTRTISTVDAKKAPVSAADVDDDDELEIVYVGLDDGKLRFVDDPTGTPTAMTLAGANTTELDGSDTTGVS